MKYIGGITQKQIRGKYIPKHPDILVMRNQKNKEEQNAERKRKSVRKQKK
jgi:hypothetical protein